MSAVIGAGISIEGIFDQDFTMTFNGGSDIATLVNTNYPITLVGVPSGLPPLGYAVALDPAGDTQVRLARAGDAIIGRIVRVENRIQEGIVAVTVQTKGGFRFYADPTSTIAVGDSLTGSSATPGYVTSVQADLALGSGTNKLSSVTPDVYLNKVVSVGTGGLESFNSTTDVTTVTNVATVIALLR